jgi:hypothetical protein
VTPDKTVRDGLAILEAEIELMGYTHKEREAWEATRDDTMLSLSLDGYSLSCIARASGYAISRVSAYVEKARERRQRP